LYLIVDGFPPIDEMEPHGPWPIIPEEIWKGVTPNPELIFEQGRSCWKALDEKKMMDIPERWFEIIKEREILMPHP